MAPFYLDHNATTPVDESVLEAMLPFFRQEYGNPSSQTHAFGWAASRAIEKSRETLAAFLQAKPKEIFFTSCATESNNLALLGLFRSYGKERPHVITCATEHKSVLSTLEALKSEGAQIEYLPVDNQGRISTEALEKAIRPHTLLVSLMAGNNEIGTRHPVEEIGELCSQRGVFFHCDAVQLPAQGQIDLSRWKIDLLSLSAHKFYGPKGVGLLFVRSRSPRILLPPLMRGGSQERELRPGTLNVPYIVAMAQAAEVCVARLSADVEHYRSLSQEFMRRASEKFGSRVRFNGCQENRLPNNISLTLIDASREKLLTGIMKTHAVSLGSACTSQDSTPSHVLKAIGLSDQEARTTLRIGLGRTTQNQELESLLTTLEKEVWPS